jgi:hypothetical protein
VLSGINKRGSERYKEENDMRRPIPKKLPRLASSVLVSMIIDGIKRLYGDKLYDEPKPCPKCGSEDYIRKGKQSRLFCRLITYKGPEEVYVYLKQYKCKRCNHKYASNGPFYPSIAYGAPIVDIVLHLAATNPYNKVEILLMEMGIQVDRDTVKRWVILFKRRVIKAAGIWVNKKPLGVNMIRLLFGVENVKELREKHPELKPTGVADETYPSIKGSKKKLKKRIGSGKGKGKSH